MTLAIVYALVSAVLVPVGVAVLVFGQPSAVASGLFMIAAPVIYFVVGYVGTAVLSFVYNLAARWTGGVAVSWDE